MNQNRPILYARCYMAVSIPTFESSDTITEHITARKDDAGIAGEHLRPRSSRHVERQDRP